MKIVMEFAHASEGRVRIQGAGNDSTLQIEPSFGSMRGPKTICYLTVKGDKGREKLYSLVVSSRSGRLSLSEFTPSPAPFDQLGPSDEDPSEDLADDPIDDTAELSRSETS